MVVKFNFDSLFENKPGFRNMSNVALDEQRPVERVYPYDFVMLSLSDRVSPLLLTGQLTADSSGDVRVADEFTVGRVRDEDGSVEFSGVEWVKRLAVPEFSGTGFITVPALRAHYICNGRYCTFETVDGNVVSETVTSYSNHYFAIPEVKLGVGMKDYTVKYSTPVAVSI